MRLRLLARSDLETVRRLRNANREWFFDEREVSEAEQAAWFDSLSSRPVDFYVIEDARQIVGTISLTRRDTEIEIGNLLLDPTARRRGLMRRAVSQLIATPGCYVARVKPGNDRSLRVFRIAGFAERALDDVVWFEKRVPA